MLTSGEQQGLLQIEQEPEGEVAGGAIECWLHGSRFDLATGRVLSPPATRPVAVFAVRVDDGGIFVWLGAHGKSGQDRTPGRHPAGAQLPGG